uniref:PKD-like family lipoprotein n=1 Tax=Pedobacter schmidteae TaxID=2201271 RepID=UPI000EB5C9E2|nr:PKD-like family lipoprotein [Pedobacter schmidteae]
MKPIHILILSLLVISSTSCYKDKGNYDYTPLEKITISGINSSYERLSMDEKITISPTVSSTLPDADFEYTWGIYDPNVSLVKPAQKMDTIGRDLKLDYRVIQDARPWILYFAAKNKKTGLTTSTTAALNVVTQFTTGWYVAKDEADKTDIDFFTVSATENVPQKRLSNIFSERNGRKLDGKAGSFCFVTNFQSPENGAMVDTKALFLTSERDVTVTGINTLRELSNFNSLFYAAPGVKKPEFVTLGSLAYYFLNDGKIYSNYSFSVNEGKFAAAQLRDNENTPYHLSKYFITGSSAKPYFFDEMSCSFLSTSPTSTVMTPLVDGKDSKMSANNNNKKLIYMAQKTQSPYTGYAILQDKTDASMKHLVAITGVTASPTAINMVPQLLSPSDKIYNATKYALNDSDEDIIYFVTGNQVWSRNLSNKLEILQYTAPADEEITFIRHRKYTKAPYTYNFVMIGTKKGGDYKIRMFSKSSGNLSANPVITLEGQGSASDAIFITPSVANNTYQPSL